MKNYERIASQENDVLTISSQNFFQIFKKFGFLRERIFSQKFFAMVILHSWVIVVVD